MKKGIQRSLSVVANLEQAHWHSRFHKDYYGGGQSGLSGKASAAHRAAALEAVLPLAHDSTILDLGCAEGLMLPPFLENGARSIHGVDRSTRRIASARALVKSNRVRFDAVELDDPACLDDAGVFEPSYDVVLCLGVYQHLDSEIRRLVLYKALQKTARYFVFRAPKATACEAFPVIERAGFQLEMIAKSPGVKKLYVYRRLRADELLPIPQEQLLGPAKELSSPPEGPEVRVEGPAPQESEPRGAMARGLWRAGAGAAVATIVLIAGLAVVRIGVPGDNETFLARPAQAGVPWDMNVVDSSANGADSLDVADLDGDGDQDLVAGWQQSGLVRLYENLGRSNGEQVWKKIDVAGGLAYMGLEDVSFADFDRDGRSESILTAVGVPGMQVALHTLEAGAHPFEAESWTTERLTGFFSGNYNTVHGVPGVQSGISVVFAGHEEGLRKVEVSWTSGMSVRQEDLWSLPVPGGPDENIGRPDVNSGDAGQALWLTEDRSGRPQGESRTAIAPELEGGNYRELRSEDMDGDGDKDILAAEEGESLLQRGLGVVWFENPAIS